MDYRTTVPLAGDPAAALASARTILATLGFEVTTGAAAGLDARGPGMHSTKQNPVLGATRIAIITTAGTLALEAELGGVRTMWRFVMWFPPLLVVGITLPMSLVFALHGPIMSFWMVVLLGPLLALPFPLLGPWFGRLIEQRTTRALDVLLKNVAGAGAAR